MEFDFRPILYHPTCCVSCFETFGRSCVFGSNECCPDTLLRLHGCASSVRRIVRRANIRKIRWLTTHIIRNIRIYPYDIIRSRRVGCSSNFIGISLYSSSFRGLCLACRDYHPILLKKKKKEGSRSKVDQNGFPRVSYTRVCTRDRESYVLESRLVAR